jgi:hypothetical protein
MYPSIKSIISGAISYFNTNTTSGTQSSTPNSSATQADVTGQAPSSKNSFLNLFNKWNFFAPSSSSSVQSVSIELVQKSTLPDISTRIERLDSDKNKMPLRCAVDKALIYLQDNNESKATGCLTEAVKTVFSQDSYAEGKDPQQRVDAVLDILKREKPLPDDELNGSKSTHGGVERKNTVMKEVLNIINASDHWETINQNNS